ncbi:GntR family transcriptional regulator [Paenibacillus antri]|uniref:GntR family transcriptional regulator n=1 Tax=Paenibacillus antri TaxID=2582848 RepID=A0A5R9G4F0_9BACL|nr:GntR family transcriptional regulator [Paenibacillus antri]TLS51237.1 GntR family transcriptional regulator [Paenibacillus antri]
MPLPIRISHDSAEPLYHQIASQMRSLIFSGQLPAGMLLPSIRELAVETECSVITIRRVYQELESEGLVRTKQGTGTFVSEVEANRKGQYQYEAVRDALKQALERIKMSGLGEREVRDVFEQALRDVFAPDAEEGTR